MTDYMTEQEQVELLKKWIKQYSLVILAGVILAVLCINGWRYWQNKRQTILLHASSTYDQMLSMRIQNHAGDADQTAKQLLGDYRKTIYAQMAAFNVARNAILSGDNATAEDNLRWIIRRSPIPAIRQIARIRLARLFIGLKQPNQAPAILKTIDDESFSGMTNEVLGDAYFAMQNYAAARDAYGKALALLPNAEVVRPILQMKYDNLASRADNALPTAPSSP